jgi:hypothetical protein
MDVSPRKPELPGAEIESSEKQDFCHVPKGRLVQRP